MTHLNNFFIQLPKIEVHAHINGSLSPKTLSELVERKKATKPELAEFRIPNSLEDIQEFFGVFKFIYQLVDDEESVKLATRNVIDEFAKDGVRYLELRSTPRGNEETGMTRKSYLEAVTSVIQEPRDDIIVKLIVSIDRQCELIIAQEIVDLAIASQSKDIVAVDLCGNVESGLFEDLRPAFEKAREHGLYVTLHFNEVEQNVAESPSILSFYPNRLGHATFLDDYCRKFIYEHKIPIEVCMTSNVLCKTVSTYEEHHIKDLLYAKHPFILCTDDKGVFFSDSSNEYKLAAETFNLSKNEMFELSFRSIDAIFGGDGLKKQLKDEWLEWKKNHESQFY